ncbi:MAG: methionine--tRNA ligase [Candidatus Gracilibacteria bacterium]|nr:methionine--tRNA ligase [Candidatus Gracilibacteria bacterium]
MKDTFYISTAIAYVNGSPHIGHALEFVEADAIARYNRLIGKDVYYLTGTDEHGSKIFDTAEKEGIDVQEMVDRNAQKFKNMMDLYQVSYDHFVRTSDQENHWPGVQKIWNKMLEKGDIYKGEYKGLYCVGCEEYKAEKDLEEKRCQNHPDREIEEVEQTNYFFKLSKYSDQIKQLITSKEVHIMPDYRANEIIAMCERGLEDVSFSRPKEQLSWGVPVPNDPDQVMYVWCDALSNYITGVEYAKEGSKWQKYWPCDVHVIGKDILRFHAGIWIGMLLSADLPLPKSELIHGFILDGEGNKMSKSLGNVIDPMEVLEKYDISFIRYFLLTLMNTGDDGNFGYEVFEAKVNADLANNLGNFSNRVLSMAERYLDGDVPSQKQEIPSELEDFWQRYHAAFTAFDHTGAAEVMIQMVNYGNKLIADTKPWEIAKDDNRTEELYQVLRICLKILLHVGFMLEPFCPDKGRQILDCFGLADQHNAEGLVKLQNNTLLDEVKRVEKGEILFERIEQEKT